jgi:hypothetical protein
VKLDDKRKVIEVLLCAGMPGGEHIEYVAANIGLDDYMASARSAWWAADPSPHVAAGRLAQYELDACEAAYRLIESSPTLRREWFGAS